MNRGLYGIPKNRTYVAPTPTGSSYTPPYKAYTALLTQTGGTNPQNDLNFSLVVGRTYQIIETESFSTLGDFTNVGAPNNNIGTYFVATGTTPNSWGASIGLSWNTGAPVATVLENTIGNIYFIYEDTGRYRVCSHGLFIDNKTTVSIDAYGHPLDFTRLISYRYVDIDRFVIYTDREGFSNDILANNRLEIKVYN